MRRQARQAAGREEHRMRRLGDMQQRYGSRPRSVSENRPENPARARRSQSVATNQSLSEEALDRTEGLLRRINEAERRFDLEHPPGRNPRADHTADEEARPPAQATATGVRGGLGQATGPLGTGVPSVVGSDNTAESLLRKQRTENFREFQRRSTRSLHPQFRLDKPFDGKEALRQFRHRFEIRVAREDWKEGDQVVHFLACLDTAPAIHYKEWAETGWLTTATMEQVWERMGQTYGNEGPEQQQALRQLLTIKQGRSPLSAFYMKFREIAQHAGQDTSATASQRFAEAIRPELRAGIASGAAALGKVPRDLDLNTLFNLARNSETLYTEMDEEPKIQFAEKEEQVESDERGRKGSVTMRRPSSPHISSLDVQHINAIQEGVTANLSKIVDERMSHLHGRNRPDKPYQRKDDGDGQYKRDRSRSRSPFGDRGASPFQRAQSPEGRQCFRCAQEGHFARDCPKPCSLCGKSGHGAGFCPDRQRDKRQRQDYGDRDRSRSRERDSRQPNLSFSQKGEGSRSAIGDAGVSRDATNGQTDKLTESQKAMVDRLIKGFNGRGLQQGNEDNNRRSREKSPFPSRGDHQQGNGAGLPPA